MFACSSRLGFTGFEKSAIWIASSGGVEKGFTVVVCRACNDPPCARACPEDALLVRRDGGVFLKPERCIGCGHCVEACDIGAIRMDEDSQKPIVCVYCGYCAQFCPHKVITLEEVNVR